MTNNITDTEKEDLISQFPHLNHLEPPIKVVISGAGLAGIITGIILSSKIPNIDLTLLERSANFGGVWFDNQYPGIQCDVPIHAYQLSFDPKKDWKSAYAAGSDIRQYWTDRAKKYGLDTKTKFGHNIKEAKWDKDSSQWILQVEKGSESLEIRADVFIASSGALNNPRYPLPQPGFASFQGVKFHPQKWPKDFSLEDLKGMRVALIGNGATGVQLLPQVAKHAAHVDHYAKEATWIAHSLFGPRVPGYVDYSSDDIDSIKSDEDYHAFRKELETYIGGKYNLFFFGTPLYRESIKELLAVAWTRVGKDPELFRKVVPTYPPGSRRLLPAPGYLEALTKPHVDFHLGEVKEFTKDGVIGFDGIERKADVVIAATGFVFENGRGYTPNYEIVGTDGYTLREHFSPLDSKLGYSASYLGLSAPGFPNLFYTLSVNSYIREAPVPATVELQATYIAQAIRKKQRERIRTIEPSLRATEAFNKRITEFSEAASLARGRSGHFRETTREGTNRVKIAWPGSHSHALAVLRDPRWEDFEYEYDGDPFAFSREDVERSLD
ncbi:putative sterigmatocystin biosynthesis monooxygenase stcW [Yarrowia sp. B02]|nr:putative sterigmatocystin biosynthesis monooxygenase stcW [Yarrowia sp. B02]